MNQKDKTTKREVINYHLVRGSCPEILSEKIGEYLDRGTGWELYGNPFCSSGQTDDWMDFYQAMVHCYYDEDEDLAQNLP